MPGEPQRWMGVLALIGMLLALAVGLVGLSGAVWLMIWPVERRARATQGKFRFRLIDLGCLLVYWQVILAALLGLGRDNMESMWGAIACFGLLFCGISALTWSVCVGVLSRARIESSACRAAFILVSIPGAIVASIGLVASSIAIPMSVFYQFADPSLAFPLWPALIGLAISIGAILLLRLVAIWIAADAKAP